METQEWDKTRAAQSEATTDQTLPDFGKEQALPDLGSDQIFPDLGSEQVLAPEARTRQPEKRPEQQPT